MCGVHFRSIQLLSVKMGLGALRSLCGGLENGRVRVAALQVHPMADARHGIPQTVCTCEDT